MTVSIETLLKEHSLRLTEPRKNILKFFLDHERAISYSEIENELGNEIDRVTVYRTLKTFLEKGLVHSIPDTVDNQRYALCLHHCHEDRHEHNHVHFKCTVCGNTTCLEEVKIPNYEIPVGFTLTETQLIANGVCDLCNG